MIHTIETLKELHEQRFISTDKAIVLAASELAVRLDLQQRSAVRLKIELSSQQVQPLAPGRGPVLAEGIGRRRLEGQTLAGMHRCSGALYQRPPAKRRNPCEFFKSAS